MMLKHTLITAPYVTEAAGILERLFDGGRRHRQEMARIRLEEERMRQEYRLMNRQLDAAFELAMQKLKMRGEVMSQQFNLLSASLVEEARQSACLRELIDRAALAAFSAELSEDIRASAQTLLPRLMDSLENSQARRQQLVVEHQRQTAALEADLPSLLRLRDGTAAGF